MKTQPFEKQVWAEIDLDALRHNFRAVKARAGDLPLCEAFDSANQLVKDEVLALPEE